MAESPAVMDEHRNYAGLKERVRRFFFPRLTRGFAARLAAVALTAYLLCRYVFIPVRMAGISMEPTYRDGGVNFCWTFRYAFSGPRRGNVVAIRLAGRRSMYLKRVLALEGETVEFRAGRLVVDGQPVDEPYVRYPCDWNMPPWKVAPGCVWVAGDNRSMPIAEHEHGEASLKRVMGGMLW